MIQAIAEWVMDELPNDQPVDGDCFIDGDDDVFVFVRGTYICIQGNPDTRGRQLSFAELTDPVTKAQLEVAPCQD
jgi:hypothetical protein